MNLDLADVSQPPRLSDLDEQERVPAVVAWFLANFQDPSESTPRDDGEFVYIWGGPYDAEEQLWDAFPDAPETLINAAVGELEGVAVQWAPHENRIVDVSEPDRSLDQARNVLAESLEQLDQIVREYNESRPPGLGHNNPPEAITPADLQDLKTAVAETRTQIQGAKPQISILERAKAVFKWCLDKAAGAIIGTTVAQKLLPALGDSLAETIQALEKFLHLLK